MGSGCPVKSQRYGGHVDPACFSMGKAQKMRFFMFVLVSKYLQSLYSMLFNLMKAVPTYTITIITTKISHFGHKNGETLDFENFRFFDMTSVIASQSRHT